MIDDAITAAVERAVAPLRDEIRALRDALGRPRGERIHASALARMFGISPSALANQLARGKSPLARLPCTTDENGRRWWDRAAAEALLARGIK